MQDDHLINYFVRNDLLKPVVDVFVANGNRYNLLNSAVLELFEYIRKVLFFCLYFVGILNALTSFVLIMLYFTGEYEPTAEIYS